MKNLLIVFLLLMNLTWAEEEESGNYTARALEGFQQFRVFASIPSSEEIDPQLVYNAIEDSCKKHGEVLAFDHTLEINRKEDNVFIISINKNEDQIIGSIEVIAEVEIQKNKQKRGSTIWKENLSIQFAKSQEEQTEQAMVNLIDKMVNHFSNDFKKANPKSKRAVFHIQKCQDR